MSNLPILLIQLRRLGDLILTFPLMAGLQKSHPQNPVWLVGEEIFLKDLQAFAPNATFFPASSLPRLAREKFEMIINLDSRPEASLCAGKAAANLKLGFIQQDSGIRIEGFWQLYRTSLTQNNRHNLFHWADLNRLDLSWPLPRLEIPLSPKRGSGRIGIFTGASEEAKRPDSRFWASLARLLLARGYKPVLLGGPAEAQLGQDIARRAGLANANFCGKTSLAQLAQLLSGLDLLISPDTGPMHLADWLGLPVLNLSMGNVNAPETGPMRPGHLVLRASMSCVGCWQCTRPRLYCRQAFNPNLVAGIAHAFLENRLTSTENDFSARGMELLSSSRDKNGLYKLDPVFPSQGAGARSLLDQFWQAAFLSIGGHDTDARSLAASLALKYPLLTRKIRQGMEKLLTTLALQARGKKTLPASFWKSQPAHSSLFAGFLEMSLQNDGFSRAAMRQALDITAKITEYFAPLP